MSTIRTADKIVALKDGQVAELGTHDQLMKERGLYYSLVTAQMAEDDLEAEEREREDTVADLEEGRARRFTR